MNHDSGRDYASVVAACKSLLGRQIDLIPLDIKKPEKKQKFLSSNIFQHIGIDPAGVGVITGKFTEKMKPYLLALKGDFTMGEISKLLTMTNPNTHRLYWLLKSYDYVGFQRYDLEELRNLLFEEETSKKPQVQYPTFYDFKRYVLDVAMASFHEMGWKVSWKPIKTGKKVTAVHFIIPHLAIQKKEPVQLSLPLSTSPAAAPTATVATNAPEKFRKLYAALGNRWKLEPYQINLIAETVGDNEVKLEKVRATMSAVNAEKATIDNEAAVLWSRLMKESPSLKTLFESRYPQKK